MAITRERQVALAVAGQAFYERERELFKVIQQTHHKMEQANEAGTLTVEMLRNAMHHLFALANRPIDPEHSAAIAGEIQFLRTTKHKANYMKNYMANRRAQGLNRSSTSPTKLSDQTKLCEPEPIDYAMLRQIHTLAEGHELCGSKDPLTRRLGQDIIKAHSLGASPAEGGGGVAKPHPAELSLSEASCGANQSLSDIGLDLPEPTKDDLDNTSSF